MSTETLMVLVEPGSWYIPLHFDSVGNMLILGNYPNQKNCSDLDDSPIIRNGSRNCAGYFTIAS